MALKVLDYDGLTRLIAGLEERYLGIGAKAASAVSADKLTTARNINGTSFNGTSAITTATWGTARSLTIRDYTQNHIGASVSVNGSANVSLRLPSEIDVATLTATTAVWLDGAGAMLRGKGGYGRFTLYAGYSAVTNEILRIDGENPDGTWACNILKADVNGNVAFGSAAADSRYKLLVDGVAKVTGELHASDLYVSGEIYSSSDSYFTHAEVVSLSVGPEGLSLFDDDGEARMWYNGEEEIVNLDSGLRVQSVQIGNCLIYYDASKKTLLFSSDIYGKGTITSAK